MRLPRLSHVKQGPDPSRTPMHFELIFHMIECRSWKIIPSIVSLEALMSGCP